MTDQGLVALTVEEAAARLRLSPRTVRRMIGAGTLPATRPGGKRWIILESEVTRILARAATAGGVTQ